MSGVPVTIRAEALGKRFRRGAQKEGRLIEWIKGRVPYEYFWALRDVSFEVELGEMLGVIGHNGAGKSTLLRILSRITRPTEGRAEVRGRVGSLLEVGTGFHPELTGRENIFLNGTVLGIPDTVIKGRLEEIVEFAGVGDFIDTPLKYYSSGMKVRLGVSVAIHLPHQIMLVDEVLAVGDAAFREKCLDQIAEVTRQGRTVMFVGHNMEMISSTCHRAIWLRNGRLLSEGPAPEIVQAYQEQAIQGSTEAGGRLEMSGRAEHGDGRDLRFTHVRLLDGSGRQIPSFRTGQEVAFAVGFERDHRSPARDLAIGITVFGHARVGVTHFESSCVSDRFEDLPFEGELLCHLERLPLTPGRYSLGLRAREGDRVVHAIPAAGSFVVFDGDYYGREELPPPGTGNVLVHHRWSVGPAADGP